MSRASLGAPTARAEPRRGEIVVAPEGLFGGGDEELFRACTTGQCGGAATPAGVVWLRIGLPISVDVDPLELRCLMIEPMFRR